MYLGEQPPEKPQTKHTAPLGFSVGKKAGGSTGMAGNALLGTKFVGEASATCNRTPDGTGKYSVLRTLLYKRRTIRVISDRGLVPHRCSCYYFS